MDYSFMKNPDPLEFYLAHLVHRLCRFRTAYMFVNSCTAKPESCMNGTFNMS